MATEKTPLQTTTQTLPTEAPPQMDQMALLAKMIADGVAAGIANQNPQKVTAGRYDPRTPFHPNKAKAARMSRKYYVNGRVLDHDTTFDEEIRLLNQITHSGRYIDRRVEVIVNNDSAEQDVEIRWKCKTPDDRFEAAAFFKSQLDMLQQVVTAQKAEDEEDELERATRPQRRHFGDTKAMREARTAAGVE